MANAAQSFPGEKQVAIVAGVDERSATKAKPEATRYERRGTPSREEATAPSERAIWDALDEGRDPTDPDNKGR